MKKHNKIITSAMALSVALTAVHGPLTNAAESDKVAPFSPISPRITALEDKMNDIIDSYAELGWNNFDGQNFNGRNKGVYYRFVESPTLWARAINNHLSLSEATGIYECPSEDIDFIGHEFTHLVTQSKLEWCNPDKETLPLMEAYSDIMGELCGGTEDWKIGTNIFIKKNQDYSLRNIADPNSTRTPDSNWNLTEKNFFTDYYELSKAMSDNPEEKFGESGSTVISHAAYVMYENGIDRDDLKKIWFGSMEKLKDITKETRFATFSDCRRAVTAAVSYVEENKRANYLEIIKNAFDEAHVYIKGDANDDGIVDTKDIAIIESYIAGNQDVLSPERRFNSADVNHDLIIDKADISRIKADLVVKASQEYLSSEKAMNSFKRREMFRFPNDTFWITPNDTAMESDKCIPNLSRLGGSIPLFEGKYAYSNYVTLNSTFYEGYDSSFRYEKEEPYYACAGFAKKLQYDYFGTTKYLQLSNPNKYVPRIGDHLRISVGGGNPHSIFITSVDGNKFTYADCNGDGMETNTIKWNQTGSIDECVSDGILSVRLDNKRTPYQFEWVERPIMIGDVNGDSFVDNGDISFLDDMIHYNFTDNDIAGHYRFLSADIDQNGVLDNNDIYILSNDIYDNNGISFGYLK